MTCKIAFEVIGSSSSISQFHQEIEHIVLTGVLSFIIFSVTRISLVVLLVFNLIELGVSLIVINQVTSEPSFKSQTTQHVVILHLIESLGGDNSSLSGGETNLIAVGSSGRGETRESDQIIQSPSFEDDSVHIFGFEHLILLKTVIEEETLHIISEEVF